MFLSGPSLCVRLAGTARRDAPVFGLASLHRAAYQVPRADFQRAAPDPAQEIGLGRLGVSRQGRYTERRYWTYLDLRADRSDRQDAARRPSFTRRAFGFSRLGSGAGSLHRRNALAISGNSRQHPYILASNFVSSRQISSMSWKRWPSFSGGRCTP